LVIVINFLPMPRRLLFLLCIGCIVAHPDRTPFSLTRPDSRFISKVDYFGIARYPGVI
jgi:hypothetical protein